MSDWLKTALQATVSLVQSYNNWTFSACTTNWAQGTQILSKYLWSAALRTVQSCMDECDKNGFTVCGMSGGDSCYGGLAIQLPNTAVDTSLCDTTCTDDSSHFCGGNNKVVVYTRPVSPVQLFYWRPKCLSSHLCAHSAIHVDRPTSRQLYIYHLLPGYLQ